MNISLSTPVNKLGYGQTGKNLLRALLLRGASVSLFPIGKIEVDQEDISDVQNSLNNQASYDSNAPSVRVYHQFDLAQHVGRGPRIGFPIFELDTFTKREVHHMASQDALFVCSDWAKSIIEKNGIKTPTYVVPLGVNLDVFKPSVKKQEGGPFVFLNCGKWEYRKGHDVLVTAFNLAFDENDDVELWMMCSNPFLKPEQTEQWYNTYLTSPLGRLGKIKFLDRVDRHEEVAKIMSAADCGVFPARAEGWNLELLEMMAVGKPVITTNYSAHTQFCNKDNSYLIDITEEESAHDGIWFHGQGRWASISEENIYQLSEYMKLVKKGGRQCNNKGIETANKFSWNNSATQMLINLEYIR